MKMIVKYRGAVIPGKVITVPCPDGGAVRYFLHNHPSRLDGLYPSDTSLMAGYSHSWRLTRLSESAPVTPRAVARAIAAETREASTTACEALCPKGAL